MADLLSELERFELELKELEAAPTSSDAFPAESTVVDSRSTPSSQRAPSSESIPLQPPLPPYPHPLSASSLPPQAHLYPTPSPVVHSSQSVHNPIGPSMPPVVHATQSQRLPTEARQLFQQDAAHLTPEALQHVKAALARDGTGSSYTSQNTSGGYGYSSLPGSSTGQQHGNVGQSEEELKRKKAKAIHRKSAGQTWEDPTLAEWPENDQRMFCGDLGNEVNDEVLTKAFSKYPSFNMARVVRDKRTGKTRGFGFVSLGDPIDLARAIKEMNGKYVGNRPIKLRKSSWEERNDKEPEKKPRSWVQAKRLKRHILS